MSFVNSSDLDTASFLGSSPVSQRISSLERSVNNVKQLNADFISVNNASVLSLDLTDSLRQGYLIANACNITFNMFQPSNPNDLNDYRIILCSLGPNPLEVIIRSIDPTGVPYNSSTFTFVGREKIFTSPSTLNQVIAGPVQGDFSLLSIPTFQGDVFLNLYSCGRGPSGNYMYQVDCEIVNN